MTKNKLDFTGTGLTDSEFLAVGYKQAAEISNIFDNVIKADSGERAFELSEGSEVSEDIDRVIDLLCSDFSCDAHNDIIKALRRDNGGWLEEDEAKKKILAAIVSGRIPRERLEEVLMNFDLLLRNEGICNYIKSLKEFLWRLSFMTALLEYRGGSLRTIKKILSSGGDFVWEPIAGRSPFDVIVSRGIRALYQILFEKGDAKVIQAAAKSILNAPCYKSPVWVEQANVHKLLEYAFDNGISPALSEGRFFNACIRYEQWDMAETGIKSLAKNGVDVEAYVRYLRSTFGLKRGGYGKLFLGVLSNADEKFERLYDIASKYS